MGLKICNIQNFSLHDGPRMRTSIFLAGCPLRCTWCHNPETHTFLPVLIYDKAKCIGCGLCAACSNGAHTFAEGHTIDRAKCNHCGLCVEKCPTGALSLSVRDLQKEEFLSVVRRQERLFKGRDGITFTGGEPLMQGEKILEYLDGLQVHTALETCGYADGDLFSRVIARMDYVMFDVKLADENEHIKYTGVSNKPILKNLEILRESGKPYLLRTPLIAGVTDTKENLSAIKEIVKDSPWETLTYNELTPAKYERIGKTFQITKLNG
ncbi:MAG: glycyl-radical enzyme activating protein [Clostridia bacterium]|nr:glycyl-radical enzyme activating protein [Clostridia bacterium]